MNNLFLNCLKNEIYSFGIEIDTLTNKHAVLDIGISLEPEVDSAEEFIFKDDDKYVCTEARFRVH